MSFSQTGVSVGGLVLVPLATTFIAAYGIRPATTFLALLVLAIAWPVNLLLVREDPRLHGLVPENVGPSPSYTARTMAPAAERFWRARDAIRSEAFLLLSASFAAILLCQTGVAVHHLHLLRQHLDTSTAAMGAATIPIGSIVGRLIAGRFADQFDKRHVAAALFVIQAVAIAALSISSHAASLLLASAFFGLTIGAVFMLQGLLVAEIFGLPSYGTVFGVLNMLTGIGAGLGPLAVGLLSESTGGYPGALRGLLLVAPLSAIAVLRVRPPRAIGARRH
jgi:MFS family permease